MPENDLFEIKKRMTAATKTSKITRTMELIASSRLHKGKILLANYQGWLRHMREAARCLPDSYFEPLGDAPKDSKKVYVVLGGSKGLSGAYSPNLLQYAKPIVSGHTIVAVGSATEAFFPKAHSFFGDEVPTTNYANTIARTAKAVCESTESDEVYIIYTRGSKHVADQLFPLKRMEEYDVSVIVEPSEQVLFPMLFEEYAESIVYEALLQAFISEQIARVSAMDSATQNADEILTDLKATYNRIRQTSITQEIITVSNAARGDG